MDDALHRGYVSLGHVHKKKLLPLEQLNTTGVDDDLEEDELKSLVNASAKMKLLDRLLDKLQAKNHRVVIFSQFVGMLDILERYLRLKELRYARLDGGT